MPEMKHGMKNRKETHHKDGSKESMPGGTVPMRSGFSKGKTNTKEYTAK